MKLITFSADRTSLIFFKSRKCRIPELIPQHILTKMYFKNKDSLREETNVTK